MRKYDLYKHSGVEWIGEIPANWETIRLGMLGSFSSSGINKKSKKNERAVKMVNYTDIIRNRKYYPLQRGEKGYMVVTTSDSKLKEHKLVKGDVVFIPSSETHEGLGYSSLIDFEYNDTVYSYHILRYRFRKKVFHRYKKYFVNHHSILCKFSKERKGTTRQIIGRNVFNSVRVVLPPLKEQKQIVEYLDSKTSLIDSLISKTLLKIELLKEKRTSLMSEAVTKGLNPNVEMKYSGVEWIGEIPANWETIRLGMLGSFSSSGINKKSKKNERAVKMVNYTDIIRNRKYYPLQRGEKGYMVVTTSDSKLKEHKLVKGDVVFIPSSETHEGLGYSSLIDFEYNDTVYSYHILRYRFRKKVFHRYKKYFVNHHSILCKFSKERKGTTRQIIGRNVFNSVRVVLPPLKEQKQIVEYLDKQTQLMDKTISVEEKKIKLLKEFRQSLISEVVTGKRKVVAL